MRNAIGPILVIVVAGLLLWGCSAAFTDHEKSNGGSGDNCPYIGPGGC